MLGPLHIEMLIDFLIGDWVQGIGWIETMVKAGFITSGRGEGILQSSGIAIRFQLLRYLSFKIKLMSHIMLIIQNKDRNVCHLIYGNENAA